MTRKSRFVTLVAVAIAIVALLALRTSLAFARFSKVERLFASVQPGQSREDVTGLLGRPNYHAGNCGVIHVSAKNCALEYVYSHPFAPLIPEYYIVSFSADDRVIEAAPWMSP